MTLGMAWVRVVGDTLELIVASDSRLSGGQNWDACPKIMLLPRSDAVISFAGFTWDAYPLMLQAYNAIKMHPPAEKRVMDLAELKGHLIRVFNHSRQFISNLPHAQTEPDAPGAVFTISGYSWKAKEFQVWTLHYDISIQGFTFRPATEWDGQKPGSHKLIAYMGDALAIQHAKTALALILRERGKLESGAFDMEPFEVMRDTIRSGQFPSVGGPIQLVKVYEHANAVPIGVYWPTKASGNVSILGRPLMEYEKIQWGVIDPDCPDRARPMEPCTSE